MEQETKLAMILLSLFLVGLLATGCAPLQKHQDGDKSFIEKKRDHKMACVKEFLRFDVTPSETKEICKYVFKRRGD